MKEINFLRIISKAWNAYDASRVIKSVTDVSAKVSTNHVFKVDFTNRGPVYVKLSYYGKFEHFKEDHIIISNLGNNLEDPYQNFMAKSLVKNNEVFMYKYKDDCQNAWVIFYNPVQIKKKMPRRLDEKHIIKLGVEMAQFHKACDNVRCTLPSSSKTLLTDVETLEKLIRAGKTFQHQGNENMVLEQCQQFRENSHACNYATFSHLPVFVDWNIGNFSVTSDGRFFSRWDYDWFRVASRVMDFYFMSRVVSDIGDRTEFSYWAEPMMEDRFLQFLKSYHSIYPLSSDEVVFMKESYRFFILNYVIKDGRHFFNEVYANKLQKEAFETHLPNLDKCFTVDKILNALKL